MASLGEAVLAATSHGVVTVIMGVPGHLSDGATTAKEGSRTILTFIPTDMIPLAQLFSGLAHDHSTVYVND